MLYNPRTWDPDPLPLNSVSSHEGVTGAERNGPRHRLARRLPVPNSKKEHSTGARSFVLCSENLVEPAVARNGWGQEQLTEHSVPIFYFNFFPLDWGFDSVLGVMSTA